MGLSEAGKVAVGLTQELNARGKGSKWSIRCGRGTSESLQLIFLILEKLHVALFLDVCCGRKWTEYVELGNCSKWRGADSGPEWSSKTESTWSLYFFSSRGNKRLMLREGWLSENGVVQETSQLVRKVELLLESSRDLYVKRKWRSMMICLIPVLEVSQRRYRLALRRSGRRRETEVSSHCLDKTG